VTDAEVIAHLARVAASEKTFDSEPRWVERHHREGVRLDLAVALRLDGVLGGGASVLLSTPQGAWERDLYGHIKVEIPGRKKTFRLSPIEWRPLKPHRNPGDAPDELRFLELFDRWHPFEANRNRPLATFSQDAQGVAAPLPRGIDSFSDYVHLCGEVWNCPAMGTVRPPPWSRVLL